MKPFFVPEDFYEENKPMEPWQRIFVSVKANAKLEKEGEWVPFHGPYGLEKRLVLKTLAEKCKHPEEKIKETKTDWYGGLVMGEKGKIATIFGYQCECGAKVKPCQFEEI